MVVGAEGPGANGLSWDGGVVSAGPESAKVFDPPTFQGDGCLPEAAQAAFAGEVGGAAVAVLRNALEREEGALEGGVIT